ncbi:ATP-binding protein [Reichenbachiella sp.]|uniref:ATP-binding protein n=1 Tax=Reichenbachiella sp. TaxID=2184521 RepID=UPI003B5AD417
MNKLFARTCRTKMILVAILLMFFTSINVFSSNSNIEYLTVEFDDDGFLEISEGWYLYWDELLTPEETKSRIDGIPLITLGAWTQERSKGKTLPSFGVATYTNRLILPHTDQVISIRIPKINYAAKLWVNNRLVYEAGRISKNSQDVLHRRKEAFVPLSTNVDTVQLTLQVANFFHKSGGMLKPIIAGPTSEFWQKNQNKVISDMILIGCLFFLGVSMLLLYFAYWRRDKAILYLGLFSLCWGYRYLSDEYAPLVDLFPELPWVWLVKLEYVSLFLGAHFGLHYLRTIFTKIFSTLFSKVISSITIPFVVITVLLPSEYLTYLLYPFFTIIFCLILYVLFVLVTTKRQNLQSQIGLLGIISGIAIVTYHMMSFNLWGEVDSTLVSIGYLMALMINALLLGKRFSVSYSIKDNQQKVAVLQNMEITEQTHLLTKTKDLLEKQVALRTRELEKVVMDLKERNNHLEQFNYIVSHNMRAPVSNILGLTNIYNKDDVQDPYNLIAVDKIKDSVHALDHVLKDLTTVLEVKQNINLPNELVDFEQLIVKIEKSIHDQITHAEMLVQLNLEIKQIMSNGAYWYSILINLISNAIKYSRRDVQSFIKITTEKMNDAHVKMVVSDNGLGIDLSNNQSDIFGLYKRFHNHVEGKGMGLFMVRTQVESMGGHISVESKPGEGTKFTIVV